MDAAYVFRVRFRLDAPDVSTCPAAFETVVERPAAEPGTDGWRFFRDALWRGEASDDANLRDLAEGWLSVPVVEATFSELRADTGDVRSGVGRHRATGKACVPRGRNTLDGTPPTAGRMLADAYDFWLFDLDGTLVDVEPAYARDVMARVGDRIGYEFSERQVEVFWHGLSGARTAQLREWGLDPETFWTALHDAEDPEARAAATYLHDDATFVTELDRPVGLVTHCQQYLVDPVLDAVGVRGWFDAVVSCTAELGWKPDPAPVYLAMDELGVRGEGGVLVGDGPNDVGAAWNAGLDAVHVERHGTGQRGRCVLGDYRVESLSELRDGDRAEPTPPAATTGDDDES